MEREVRFDYDNSMDLLNALESLSQILPAFGVKFELLNGGDGYEEVRITKIEEKEVGNQG